MQRRVHNHDGGIASPAIHKQKRRTLIPACAAIFPKAIGDYWSPPMNPEIFQPAPSLVKQS
jgi:hypothetical protein